MPTHGPVSVAMATYNGASYIWDQLRSLANQEMLPAELVVCDDLSTDGTIELLEAFARDAPFPVRIHRNETRLRFADNFIKAIGLCREPYIAFCDQDDVWHSDKLRKSVECLTASGALMCSHRVDLIDQAGNPLGASTNASDIRLLRGETFSPWGVFLGFTCTIDRRLLEVIDPATRPRDLIEYDRPMSHDRWFYFVAGSCGSVVHLDESLAQYRQHDRNVFGRTRDTIVGRARKAVRKYPAYIRQRATIAAENLRLLERARNRSETEVVAESVDRWRRIADFYAMRQGIFGQPTLSGRLWQLMLALRRRDYRPGWGCGGARLVLQDLIAAIIMR
jgi:glycosyltransferase involved in cell wall biosynthesis